MTDNRDKVLVISETDSFLAKSLVRKLGESGMGAMFAHMNMKEIEEHREDTVLIVLFLGENLPGQMDFLVFLKDFVSEQDIQMLLIGGDELGLLVKKTIPDMFIIDRYTRPLDIDAFIKKVSDYVKNNTGENRKKTVLIVDDDITYMRTVYEWLKDEYHVGMASNGVQAISYLAKNKADLILLDYEMPIANGPQVLSMLKNDSETGQIPVMFLTGHGDKDSVMSVLGLSPVDYLLKTIEKDRLLEKLNHFFKMGTRI